MKKNLEDKLKGEVSHDKRSSELRSMHTHLDSHLKRMMRAGQGVVQQSGEEFLEGPTGEQQSEEFQQEEPIHERFWFKSVIGGAVVANAIQLGVESDYPEHVEVYSAMEHFFTALFTSEMVLKIALLQWFYFYDTWNILDFSLVLMSILDCWILGSLGVDIDLRSFSILRILRIVRVIRAIRLIPIFYDLWKMVCGLTKAIGAVFWAALTMLVIFYIFGIFFCAMIGQSDTWPKISDIGDDYHSDFDVYEFYGTVPRAMYTLFEMCLEPTNLRPILERQVILLPIFLFFIMGTTFGALNVIIGIIVDNCLRESPADLKIIAERDAQIMMQKVKLVHEACIGVDTDHKGMVALDELSRAMQDPDVAQILEEVELPLGMTPQEFFFLVDVLLQRMKI